MVRANPGCKLLAGDWAAVQWAIYMWKASTINDPPGYHLDLLNRQQAGTLDPHNFLADRFTPGGKATEETRQVAKKYTYGLAFTQGKYKTVCQEAGHSLATGKLIAGAFLEAFKLEAWWEAEIQGVLEKGYIESPGGLRRYFWDPPGYSKRGELTRPKPQEILATAAQHVEVEIMKSAMISCFSDMMPGVEMLTTTHDSLLAQCPEEKAEEGAIWLKGKLESPVATLDNRTWRANVGIGDNWKEASE